MSLFWLRRSSFKVDKAILLVIELFLPGIEVYTDDQNKGLFWAYPAWPPDRALLAPMANFMVSVAF